MDRALIVNSTILPRQKMAPIRGLPIKEANKIAVWTYRLLGKTLDDPSQDLKPGGDPVDRQVCAPLPN
jgi:hypothetical protein